jgi:hypothetical protein
LLLVGGASTNDRVDSARAPVLFVRRHSAVREYGATGEPITEQCSHLASTSSRSSTRLPALPPPALATTIADGQHEIVLGTETRAHNPAALNTSRDNCAANRVPPTSRTQFHQELPEYRTGLRAFDRQQLSADSRGLSAEDFVFGNEIIARSITAGARLASSPVQRGTRKIRHRSTSAGSSQAELVCHGQRRGIASSQWASLPTGVRRCPRSNTPPLPRSTRRKGHGAPTESSIPKAAGSRLQVHRGHVASLPRPGPSRPATRNRGRPSSGRLLGWVRLAQRTPGLIRHGQTRHHTSRGIVEPSGDGSDSAPRRHALPHYRGLRRQMASCSVSVGWWLA